MFIAELFNALFGLSVNLDGNCHEISAWEFQLSTWNNEGNFFVPTIILGLCIFVLHTSYIFSYRNRSCEICRGSLFRKGISLLLPFLVSDFVPHLSPSLSLVGCVFDSTYKGLSDSTSCYDISCFYSHNSTVLFC